VHDQVAQLVRHVERNLNETGEPLMPPLRPMVAHPATALPDELD